MPAASPADICRLFQRAMADGDMDAVLGIYDPDVAFVRQSGEVTRGVNSLRGELAPLVAARTRFDFAIKQIAETGDIALMHTEWKVSGSQPMTVHAVEVARRQADGTWRWLIGDPYTVARNGRAGQPDRPYP